MRLVDERLMLDVSLLLFVVSVRRARVFFSGKVVKGGVHVGCVIALFRAAPKN